MREVTFAFLHPIIITQNNYVIDGYARWKPAKRKGRTSLSCIQYCLTPNEALAELIRRHRRSQGMNDFNRISLALEGESDFKDQAFLNRQAGGRLKGLSKLTTDERVNSGQRLPVWRRRAKGASRSRCFFVCVEAGATE